MLLDAERIKALLAMALARPAGPERAAWLAQACGSDENLHAHLGSLLTLIDAAPSHTSPPSVLAPGADRSDTPESPSPGGAKLGWALAAQPAAPAPIPCFAEEAGSVIGRRYTLLQRLGEGGMGTVWMAEQHEPVRRKVALKVIKPGMDSTNVLARFEAERQALALMDHPHIAKVFDAGTTESGRPYFVMELVKGVPITRYCDAQWLTIRQRLDLFLPVCQAIQHAHQKGIIHRDIKPSNVLVALYDGKPVPKVIDFGVAKALGQQLTDKTLFTEFGAVIGTLEYMSPEQAELNQLDIDTRSDIYSLGVLLYQLLTGTTPLRRETVKQAALDEVLRRIREQEPPRPSTRLSESAEALTGISSQRRLDPAALTREVRGDLDWIVMKALEKDRSRRYETANGLALDLQRHLNDEPVLARPPTTGYRMRKFVRKHRSAVTAAAGFVLLLGIAAVVSAMLAAWANQERRQASSANRQLIDTLGRMRLQRAEEMFERNDSATALAYLARDLRENAGNRVVAERLLNALNQRRFVLPHAELQAGGQAFEAAFTRDGERVIVGSLDGTARILDVHTGKTVAGPIKICGNDHAIKPLLSPDAKQFFGCCYDEIRLVDPGTGTAHGKTVRVEGGQIYFAEFSPDWNRLATVSADRTVRVWNARTFDRPLCTINEETRANCIQFSPDGYRLAIGTQNGIARVWDARTGQALTPPIKHEREVACVAFNRNGQWIATGSLNNSARVWDAASGMPITPPLKHNGFVGSVRFSPDGKQLLTASSDTVARLWVIETGQPVGPLFKHRSNVTSATFSPDGHWVVTTSEDMTARIWNAATGEALGEPLRHDSTIWKAEFSPNGRQVITTSHGEVKIWEVPFVRTIFATLRHSNIVNSAEFSADGTRVVTASMDDTARIWNADTGQPLTGPMRLARRASTNSGEWKLNSARFSPDGSRVVTTAWDGTVRIWDGRTGQPLGNLLDSVNPDPANTAEFSPDGRWVLTASRGVRLWDGFTGILLGEPFAPGGQFYSAAHFSSDGRRVLTASEGGAVQIWDASTGRELTAPLRHDEAVADAEFSRDGTLIVTWTRSKNSSARVWDAHSTALVSGPFGRAGAKFSPDGRRVVTISDDYTARVWDTRTGQPLVEPFRHGHVINSAVFSPDGNRILTASTDRTARIWDVSTGHPLSDPIKHHQALSSAGFSPDGNRIVTASWSGAARIWDLHVAPVPVPHWWPDLVESIVGKRLNTHDVFEVVSPTQLLEWKRRLSQNAASDFYSRWARNFFADRGPGTNVSASLSQ